MFWWFVSALIAVLGPFVAGSRLHQHKYAEAAEDILFWMWNVARVWRTWPWE